MDALQPNLDDSQLNQSQSQNQNLDTPQLEDSVESTVAPAPQDAKPKKLRGQPKQPPRADRPPGKSLLPLTRVQKIMKADKELPTCAKEAVFLISVATEEFIKRLGQAGQQQALREKRSTVQRRDVVTAVRRADEFVFLEEILSAVSAVQPAASSKRKQKTTGFASDTVNIKDAFDKSKSKEQNGQDVDEEEAGELDEGQGDMSDTAAEGGPALGLPGSADAPEEDGDSMDVS